MENGMDKLSDFIYVSLSVWFVYVFENASRNSAKKKQCGCCKSYYFICYL